MARQVSWLKPCNELFGQTPKEWLVRRYPESANSRQLAEELSSLLGFHISYEALRRKASDFGLKKTDEARRNQYQAQSELYKLPLRPALHVFDDYPDMQWDDFVSTSDWHIPYFNERLAERMVLLAKNWRPKPIKKLIIGGDFMDFGQLGIFLPFEDDEPRKLEEDLEVGEQVLTWLTDWFDEILLLKANHEERLAKALLRQVSQERLNRLLASGLDKIKFSNWKWCVITDGKGNEWRVTHPSRAWKLLGRLAQETADTELQNIILTHSHVMSWTYQKSGAFQCVDSGGMFEPDLIGYYKLEDRPRWKWCPGFVIVANGKPHLFNDKLTDWDMYREWLDIPVGWVET